MITVYNIVARGGSYDDAYEYITNSFYFLEDAEKYLKENCTLQGQDMQEKYGQEDDHYHNYLRWKPNKAYHEESESWEIEHLNVCESYEEAINESEETE